MRVRLAICALAATLACCLLAAGARADKGVVPAEGQWLGITNAGLPVSFAVAGGRVGDIHFAVEWGPCGRHDFTGLGPASPEIDSVIERWWSINPGLERIEGNFVSPERAEGRVVAPARKGSPCPRTEVNFAAELGRVPSVVKPQVFAVDGRRTGHHSIRPKQIAIRPGFGFRIFAWEFFGPPVAVATGEAVIRGRYGKTYTPVAHLRLGDLVLRPAGYEVYGTLRYQLYGRLPAGFLRRGRVAMLGAGRAPRPSASATGHSADRT